MTQDEIVRAALDDLRQEAMTLKHKLGDLEHRVQRNDENCAALERWRNDNRVADAGRDTEFEHLRKQLAAMQADLRRGFWLIVANIGTVVTGVLTAVLIQVVGR